MKKIVLIALVVIGALVALGYFLEDN